MSIEKIGTIIPRILKDIKLTKNEDISRPCDIESLWSKVAGEIIRAHSYVYKVTQDSLIIRVDSSSCLLELTLKKEDILKNINKESIKKFKKLIFVI